ncbi:serine dehydratase beta chain [Klebsiella pneumoniae]
MSKVVVDVYGSLSLTGKGHHTDIAIIMGLAGNLPDTRRHRRHSGLYSGR